MTSAPPTGRPGSENVKNGRQVVINTKRTDLNIIDSATNKGPVRPVRVKRTKEQDVPKTSNSDVKNESGAQIETVSNNKKSKIAVLKTNGQKGNGVDVKTAPRDNPTSVTTERSPTVQKRSNERHIHFSDEQDKFKSQRPGTNEPKDPRKIPLKDKREFFRRSKSSSNSDHVSEELSPFSESKAITHSEPSVSRGRETNREEIPLKEFAKTGDFSSTRDVVPLQTIKRVDQTDTHRGSHDDGRSKEHITRRDHTHPSSDRGDLTDHSKHAQRPFRSPNEQRRIKPDTPKHERSTLSKQHIPKQSLLPDIISPVIEKSKSQQRLQNQSSTETSGLGETITSGFTSQESLTSVHSYQTSAKTAQGNHSRLSFQEDLGIDLREDTTTGNPADNDTLETETIDSPKVINGKNEQGNHCENIKSRFINKSGPIHTPSGDERAVDIKGREIPDKLIRYRPMKEQVDQHQIHFLGPTDQLNNNGASKKRGSQPNTAPERDNLDQVGGNHAVTDFDELFQQSQSLPHQPASMGLGIEQINNEWNRHTRASSIKSIRSNRSSQGSFRSRSGSTRRSRRFLGEQESKWMKWGRERRSSFRRRLDKLEHPEPEVPKRPSTPIKKARQEGRMFIHPDLESKYISEEDINYIQRHQQQRLQTYNVIEKSKASAYQFDRAGFNRLTANDLNILARFWEHRVFVRSRYISILLSFITVVIYIIGISSSNWILYPSEEVIGAESHEGLFFACRPIYIDGALDDVCDGSAQRESVTIITKNETGPLEERSYSLREPACERSDDNETSTMCLDAMPNWQNAVIGLMVFSAAFGFVSAVLAVLGVCTSPLPKKIYYFHSAGEIFFVCALSTTVALIIYPVAIAMDSNIHSHTFGSGYRLGWGGAAFFYAASLCMSLDELVRESAQNKCCRYICWRTRDRGEQQQV